MRVEMTQKELAELSGYTYRRLFDINKALPESEKFFVKGEGAKYDLALFIQRWMQYNVERAKVDDDDFEVIKAQHERVKMKKSELELAKMKVQLIEVEAVKRLWEDIAAIVTQKLLYLPAKIAPGILMMGNAEKIEAIIDREIRQTLTMIADTPLPKSDIGYPKAPEPLEGEE